ncbi:MAG: chemotaxis protein CheX [Deltaproteobacteria bacterium]|nr:chemotaxis protein CheX [Deltaproteobacteria bacterium]
MNVIYINAFIESAINVLKVMAFMEAKAGKPYLKNDSVARGDVSGIIAFSGSLTGSLALSFSESCILKIVSNMLGEEIKTINNITKDAAGELTNMISGDARKRLQSQGHLIGANIPAVLSGKGHLIRHVLGGPSIVVPFQTEFGEFVVDVNIKDVQ